MIIGLFFLEYGWCFLMIEVFDLWKWKCWRVEYIFLYINWVSVFVLERNGFELDELV